MLFPSDQEATSGAGGGRRFCHAVSVSEGKGALGESGTDTIDGETYRSQEARVLARSEQVGG